MRSNGPAIRPRVHRIEQRVSCGGEVVLRCIECSFEVRGLTEEEEIQLIVERHEQQQQPIVGRKG